MALAAHIEVCTLLALFGRRLWFSLFGLGRYGPLELFLAPWLTSLGWIGALLVGALVCCCQRCGANP